LIEAYSGSMYWKLHEMPSIYSYFHRHHISSPCLGLELFVITSRYKLPTSTLVVQTLGKHLDVLVTQRLLILRFLAIEEHIRIASSTFADVFLGFLNLRATEANPPLIPVTNIDLSIVDSEAIYVILAGNSPVGTESVTVAIVPDPAFVGGRNGSAHELEGFWVPAPLCVFDGDFHGPV
jgi:hypothetical protein